MHRIKQLTNVTKIKPHLRLAIILTAVYLLAGIAWILLSDTMVMQIARNNSELFNQLQNKKGIAFVVLSGMLIFFITYALSKRIQKKEQQKFSLEQKIHALNNANPGGIIDYNILTGELLMNEKMNFFYPTANKKQLDFLTTFLQRIHANDRQRIQAEYEAAVASTNSTLTTEFKLLGTDNNYYTVISTLFLIRNEEGKLERLIGEIQNITQLRNLQSEYFSQQLKHKHRLASTIIKAQENERNRWAQELHDNVSQILTVINLYLSNHQLKEEKNIQMIEQAKCLVNEVQQEIRLLSSSIKPPSFALTTLEQSLNRLIADISRVKNISFNFNSSDFDETLLTDEQKLMAYRIVQEQLNNIIKYADATHIEIALYFNKEESIANIILTDNGKGFDKNKLKTGLGFRNIQSRLQLYNGQMEIESTPGNGCTLAVNFQV
jgi:two-component system, NarL family, sensor histidine kinase UhpB